MAIAPATRQTRQKEAIANVFARADRALCLEEILEEGRQHYEALSERTVFRRLRELMEEGQLVRVYLPGHPARYEVPTRLNRPHLVCRDCAQVFVLPEETPSLLASYPTPPGFELNGEEVIFYGRCPECRQAAPTTAEPAPEGKN